MYTVSVGHLQHIAEPRLCKSPVRLEDPFPNTTCRRNDLVDAHLVR